MPDSATVKTSKAAVGFQYCTKLFSLEKGSKLEDAVRYSLETVNYCALTEKLPEECHKKI